MSILITGAGRGIGRGLAAHYATGGAAVIGTHRGAAPAALPGVEWQEAEMTDPASLRALAGRLGGRPLSLLVCNAGIYPDRDEGLDTGYPPDMWARAFAINTTGVFLTIQALLPNLQAAGGRIAILSSQMASDARAPGGSYIYRASKAAALNLGRNLAVDLRPRGVAVGIYHPGWVKSDMGGAGAQIEVAESVSGLAARFAALSLDTTGAFLNYDGTAMPF